MIQDKHMVLSGPIPPIQRKPLAYIRSSTKRPTHAGGWYLSAYIYLFVCCSYTCRWHQTSKPNMCVASLSIFADAHLHIHHSNDFARTHMFVFLLVEVWLYKDVFTLFHLHVCKSYLTVICYKFIDGDTWATVAFTTNFNPRVFHTYPFPLSPCITV